MHLGAAGGVGAGAGAGLRGQPVTRYYSLTEVSIIVGAQGEGVRRLKVEGFGREEEVKEEGKKSIGRGK